MSGHERERLSAYLDDELAPGERAQVGEHLAACAECSARLAELAAVDQAAAALAAEAPPGYFEALPARVRARLDGRAAPRRLPAWTWAAAAALLLAVVTPLTLLHQRATEPLAPLEAPAAAAPRRDDAQRLEEARAPEPAQAPAEAKARAQVRSRAPEPTPPAPGKREADFANAPADADARLARQAVAPAPQAIVPAAPGAVPPAAPPAATAVTPEREAARAYDEAATEEGLVSATAGAAARDRVASASVREERAAEADGLRLGRTQPSGGAAAVAASPKLVALEGAWRRLEAARPGTPAEWRRLREEWRRFAASDPDGPRADEARVRVIEAGREAWRAASDPADEKLFRSDAAAYLLRDDAKQKERVRSLLR